MGKGGLALKIILKCLILSARTIRYFAEQPLLVLILILRDQSVAQKALFAVNYIYFIYYCQQNIEQPNKFIEQKK